MATVVVVVVAVVVVVVVVVVEQLQRGWGDVAVHILFVVPIFSDTSLVIYICGSYL